MRKKDQTLRQYADALCELLENCQIQQQLKDREIALLQDGFREEAREYAQIYSILIALLDEMVDLLGEEVMSGKEFAEILDAGFAEAKVGIIPPGIDQVQVGDIERSRLAHIKVLFFLGLNDGWVPARGEGGGIVSDMERELLQQSGISLAPSARENSYIQRFYLYQNLTKPEDRLYLSWCSSSGDGAAMRPSYLVATIGRLFPQMSVRKEEDAGSSITQVTSRKNGLLYLTKQLQEIRNGAQDPAWMELYGMYLQDEQYSSRVQELVRAAFIRGLHGQLSYQTSRELYGEVMTNSVTRLEQFAACAFAHFALYGLRLSPRELYGVKAADLGIIFHRAMELFSRRLQSDGIDWREMKQEEQSALMEECVDAVAAEYGSGILHGSARAEYTICRVKRILCRAVWALHRQLQAGDFRPTGFEVSFADAGDLEAVNVRFGENGKIRLQGRIDRIDTAEKDDAVYVKIIDYKSGNTKFDPVSLYYGLQLQLVVYLNAALEMERRLHRNKEIIPAGIFYYHLDDPILEKEEDASDELMQEKLLKKLRPDGILNGDHEVLRLLDRGISGDSLVIPAGLKKDGTLKATSSAVSTEQFGQLSGFVSRKMKRMAGQILEGCIDASPFEDRTGSACDYCDYSDVCGFDRKIPGMFRKRSADLSKAEVWEKLAEEERRAEDGEKLAEDERRAEAGGKLAEDERRAGSPNQTAVEVPDDVLNEEEQEEIMTGRKSDKPQENGEGRQTWR
jgi:ATP-dependent helicase/nuclease subunit B